MIPDGDPTRGGHLEVVQFTVLVLLTLLASGLPGSSLIALLVVPVVVGLAARTQSTIDLSHVFDRRVWALTSVAFIGINGLMVLSGYPVGTDAYWPLAAAIGSVACVAAFAVLNHPGWVRTTGWAVALGGTIVFMTQMPEASLDVWLLHSEAATAITEGSNPYSAAVAVPNGSPWAVPGEEIVGYPYPPATLVWYALGGLLGEPRIASIAAWIVLLGVALGLQRGNDPPVGFLLLAILPAWPLILWATWTEPVTLAYLSLAVWWWERRPGVSGALLGLALASKQYLAPALPLLVLAPFSDRRRRLGAAAIAGAGSLIIGLIPDPRSFIQAIATFHLSQPPRPDSSNLFGLLAALGWDGTYPNWIGFVVPAATATWLARKGATASGFIDALCTVLVLTFFLGSQAFANYWFLAAGLFVLARIQRPMPAVAPGGLPSEF